MAEQKTKPTDHSVETFLDGISEEIREDCYDIIAMMKRITKKKPVMWGPSIIGFGKYHYQYESGHEGNAPLTGFSPRKQNLTLYIYPGFAGQEALLKKLGKYKTGKGCLYIKRLKDVDKSTLEKLIKRSVDYLSKKYN